MKIRKIFHMAFISSVLLGSAGIASAGFMDAFNRANQTIQQTTGTINNTKNTVKGAQSVLPKSQKQPEPTAKTVEKQPTGDLTAKDRTAIEKAKRAWVAAFKSKDWDALIDQYAEDAVILPPDEKAQTGREAVRATFATDDKTSNEVFETIEINGDENIAYAQGTFNFTITSGNNPPVNASGKYMEIWQKQEDGSWLITHDIWNSQPAN